MSRQHNIQATVVQRPTVNDKELWKAYWKAQGQPWRIEPEIDKQRQEDFARQLRITPNIEQGIYPFKNVKLTRADTEWLLATHEDGRGPVDWNDEKQRRRERLDLRGADLRQADLHALPLAFIHGGLNEIDWIEATLEQRDMAAVHLEGASLREAHLEGAILCKAHLEQVNLRGTHLEGANLYKAHLEGAYLRKAYLGGTCLQKAFFDGSTSIDAAVLEDEKLGFVLLADAHWGDMNLSDVNWAQIKILGDEYEAQQPMNRSRKTKTKAQWISGYKKAVRANRQLAAVLRNQGVNEEADRFAYRAQLLQCVVLRLQVLQPQASLGQRIRKLLSYVFSLFLDLLAGYGYKPGRSVLAYLVVIVGFMLLYLLNARFVVPHLRWDEALVLSVSSFHGRGFFSQDISLGDTYARLAAAEALIGLIIEISFIATFTQRFFGK